MSVNDCDIKNKKRNRVGWIYRDNINIASSRIRYINIINFFRKSKFKKLFEKYDAKKNNQYFMVIFCKLFNDEQFAMAQSLKNQGIKIGFDICDNYFDTNYVKKDLSEKFVRMIDIADYVIASSETLKEFVIDNFDYKKNVVIEDYIEKKIKTKFSGFINGKFQELKYRFFLKKNYKNHIKLVWFGSATSGMKYIAKLKDLLEKYSKNYPIILTVISDNKSLFEDVTFRWNVEKNYIDWNGTNFISILKLQDAALIPIEINDFSICKTNNRLIQSIECGLDVISDKIPSYQEFSDYCFLNDWDYGLQKVIESKSNNAPKLIRIEKAKQIIKNKYRLDIIANKWLNFLLKLKDVNN